MGHYGAFGTLMVASLTIVHAWGWVAVHMSPRGAGEAAYCVLASPEEGTKKMNAATTHYSKYKQKRKYIIS